MLETIEDEVNRAHNYMVKAVKNLAEEKKSR